MFVLSSYLFIYLFVCLFVCLFVYLFVYLSIGTWRRQVKISYTYIRASNMTQISLVTVSRCKISYIFFVVNEVTLPCFYSGFFFPLFCATFLFYIYANEVLWKKLRWQFITIFNVICFDVNCLYHNLQTLQNSPDICLKPCGEVADSKQYQKIYLLQILFLLFHYKVFLFHNSCNQLKKKLKLEPHSWYSISLMQGRK